MLNAKVQIGGQKAQNNCCMKSDDTKSVSIVNIPRAGRLEGLTPARQKNVTFSKFLP
jgi:hypothetical protein